MNSRCICAATRGAFRKGRVIGIRMRVPSYPSNREADEHAIEATAKAGRCASRMRPSRETCLHRESIIPLGVGYAIGPEKTRVRLVFLREGRFLCCPHAPRRFAPCACYSGPTEQTRFASQALQVCSCPHTQGRFAPCVCYSGPVEQARFASQTNQVCSLQAPSR